MNDTRTLEQAIEEAVNDAEEAINPDGTRLSQDDSIRFVADAVRKWMWEHDMARIKELEAEVINVRDLLDQLRPIREAQERRITAELTKVRIENAQLKEEIELLKSQKCAMPGAASCAKVWETQHQMRALQEYGLAEEFPFGIDAIQHVAEALIAARAEVERLKAMTYLPSNEAIDKAAKYDALRERFPFWPGEEFYATVSSKRLILNVGDPIPELIIYKRTVNLVGVNGVLDTKDNTWNWDECHPTADSCRAAIPVEE